jgi:hypothetical protein
MPGCSDRLRAEAAQAPSNFNVLRRVSGFYAAAVCSGQRPMTCLWHCISYACSVACALKRARAPSTSRVALPQQLPLVFRGAAAARSPLSVRRATSEARRASPHPRSPAAAVAAAPSQAVYLCVWDSLLAVLRASARQRDEEGAQRARPAERDTSARSVWGPEPPASAQGPAGTARGALPCVRLAHADRDSLTRSGKLRHFHYRAIPTHVRRLASLGYCFAFVFVAIALVYVVVRHRECPSPRRRGEGIETLRYSERLGYAMERDRRACPETAICAAPLRV